MALIISVAAFGIFTALLWLQRIGEASFCFLVAATALLGLVLHGFRRLQELDLKNLRLVLRELEQTKKELFVREEKLKAMAVPLAQMIALTGATEGRWSGSAESVEVKRRWYRDKLQSFLSALEFTATEAAETQKFMDKYGEIDQVFRGRGALKTSDPDYDDDKKRLKNLANDVLEMMKADLANTNHETK